MNHFLTSAVALSLLTSVGFAQANDECTGAVAIVDGSNGPFDTTAATPSGLSSNDTGNDLWFSYVATCTGNITFETCPAGTDFDTKIAAFSDCPTTVGEFELANNDDNCPGFKSAVTFSATSGVTYYLAVGGFRTATGMAEIMVTCAGAVANDECSGAEPIVNGINGIFNNASATTSADASSCGVNNDLWYVYTATCDGTVAIETCDLSTIDTKLAVYSGDCAALVELDCNDDACSLRSRVEFAAVNGQDYYVRAGTFSGTTPPGDFSLNVLACNQMASATLVGVTTGAGNVSASGLPRLGTTVEITLSNAQPDTLCVVGKGFAAEPHQEFPTCNLESYIDLNRSSTQAVFGMTDSSGMLLQTVEVPADITFCGFNVCVQFFCADNNQPCGLAQSQAICLVVGC